MPTLKEQPDVTDRVEASRRMRVTPGVRGVGGGRIMRAAAGAKPAGLGGGSVARPPGLLSSLISPRANNLLSLE